ncbi:MAG: OmpA/MotB family protein [Planctomycetota bacterium]|jgi:chemotaxis protein MotB
MAKKKHKASAGAPAWMVTYGDMMTLLLCFFVLLVAMSEIKQEDKFLQVVESLRHAFGYETTLETAPGDVTPVNALIRELQTIIIPPNETYQGDADEEGIDGRVHKVTDVRDGIEIVVGGRIAFDRFSAVLKPKAEERITRVAEKIRGKNTKIIVRGHATAEPLPEDSLYPGPMDLSYARARAVADVLTRSGVRGARVRIEANGDREPINSQAYTEERRAVNRRVEIIVTEALLQEYAGKPMTGEQEEPPDAR